jgi:serine/threonine protein kinase/formylglycine-generating enzyme required for sulfatase activity
MDKSRATDDPFGQPDADHCTAEWRDSALGGSTETAPPAEPKPLPAILEAEKLPDHIGRYRVESILGSGAFGIVYQCQDETLQRRVAVKAPHRHLLDNPEMYLAEARVLASLEHPAIVPVYDAGQTDDGLCYVVSKFIEGSNLRNRIQEAPLSRRAAVELTASISDALHCAHVHGVVHRDLKPANILLDLQARPYLADFGLALRDEEFGQHGKGAGTPMYMSPEQARCEGHLVDGRSDIFSLGVVLYELLTAARPFRGSSIEEILERIRMLEPRPPRQIDDSIPKELERICLKAIAKRASDRYNTALDMSDDLRAFLAEFGDASTSRGSSSRVALDASPVPAAVPAGPETQALSGLSTDSDKPVKIVPKGLRSFDQSDADFFLKLLPGPHDRHGLPEGIRFWKTRIEDADPDTAFRAGIIYGPSGCGKSSLVKAGLLPRLDRSIVKVYIEAAGNGTEERLLRSVRRQLPGVNEQGDLTKVLAAVRRGNGLAPGEKLLLVIDQFEQWLHAAHAPAGRGEEESELVMALRQCDGVHVQCILMVRDDFWLAVSRFMQALEVRVAEGENSRLVDLFDQRHARKVLAALGVAFGALPETERTKEQEAFINQAVTGLAQDGKIVPVRLALFAEMFKSKSWTPSALREIGGAEGVGVAFLEETFSSLSAPPQHRLLQKPAQAVLSTLLPEPGADIKGRTHSREELLEASGCKTSPRQFEDLMALLDRELRLVSPADSDSLDAAGDSTGNMKYQLTHDYLVPSLRSWLTRKQKATRRGRAELRLADIASFWAAKPENRRLPSLLEFLLIRFYTSPGTWTDSQRTMMRAAGRLHGLRWAAALVVVAAIAFAGYEIRGRSRANALREELYSAEFNRVPIILDELAQYQRWAVPALRRDLEEATNNLRDDKDDEAKSRDNRTRLRASLALLPSDDSQTEFLYDSLIAAPPDEVDTIRRALLARERKLPVSTLEAQLEGDASGDPSDPKVRLVTERKAHAAITLLLLKQADKVWPLFKNSPDETVRSYLIHSSSPLGVDPQIVADHFFKEADAGSQAALLLLLGEYPDFGLRDGQRDEIIPKLLAIFDKESDAGVHSAAQWLLRKWHCEDILNAAVDRLSTNEIERKRNGSYEQRRWYINRQGQTFVVVDATRPFLIGSPDSEHGPDIFNETQQRRTIGRHYAIAVTPVTIEKFRRFQLERPEVMRMPEKDLGKTLDSPQTGMTWYEAAEYCNWLSEKDEIPREQWCYRPNGKGQFGEGMRSRDGYLALTGYRLPTEAEWEFACRAGTTTRFYCGQDDSLLGAYAWFQDNIHSQGFIHPVARLKPNDLGLFDLHGNVWQWCECPPSNYTIADDSPASEIVTNDKLAAVRGGAYENLPRRVRAAFRGLYSPKYRQPVFGFRPVRTIGEPSK